MVDGVNVTDYIDRESGVRPGISDLHQQIETLECELVDVPGGLTPKFSDGELGADLTAVLYDDDDVTVIFRGRTSEPAARAFTGSTRIPLVCQSEAKRAYETAIPALNKSGVIDTDRNFVIAMWTAALQALAFAGATGIDDAIYTANAPDWPGVHGTAIVAGRDWSYMDLNDAMNLLLGIVPSVFWRVRHSDLILEYGPFIDAAPFAVGSVAQAAAAPTYIKAMDEGSYEERLVTAGTRNKLKLGGAAASTATAYNEAHYSRVNRVLEAPYVNDTSIPAADLRRLAYAKLAAQDVRRRVSFSVRDAGLRAGQLVDVGDARIGSGGGLAPWPEVVFPVMARSDSGLLAGGRGRFAIQKVERVVEGPGSYVWQVEAGDYVRDFATTLANLTG